MKNKRAITAGQIATIRNLHKTGHKRHVIAKQLGVSGMTVYRYTTGKYAAAKAGRKAKRGRPRTKEVVSIVHNHNKLGPGMNPALHDQLERAVASLIRMLPDKNLIDLVAQVGEGRNEELRSLSNGLRDK